MMSEWIVHTIVGVGTGVAGWLVGRRKEQANIQGLEYENFEKFVIANGKMIGALKKEIGELLQTIAVLRERNVEQDRQIDELRQELKTLKDEFPCSDCPRRL